MPFWIERPGRRRGRSGDERLCDCPGGVADRVRKINSRTASRRCASTRRQESMPGCKNTPLADKVTPGAASHRCWRRACLKETGPSEAVG
jgi:hypothetical protein